MFLFTLTPQCIYIAEIATASQRGALVGCNELGITAGFVLAFAANAALIDVENGWRSLLSSFLPFRLNP